MKNIALLILVLFYSGYLYPQKLSKKKIRKHLIEVSQSKLKGTVILSLDTIYDKGRPYAILRKKKQLPYYQYTLFSLGNNELAQIETRISINKERTPYYAFIFEASEKTAEAEKYYGYMLEAEIVKYQLVSGNTIDAFNETTFLRKFPCKFSDLSIKTYVSDDVEKDKINPDHLYETVKRNKDAAFYFSEGKIVQDYKIIGRYKMYDSVIRFYLPSGIELAQADEKEDGSNAWKLTSLKDNKTWNVNAAPGKALEDLVKFLVGKDYF